MTGSLPDQEMQAPPGKFVSVYITAKLIHAKMLVDIRKDWPRLYFTPRWMLTANLPSEQAKPASLWTRDNRDDIIRSDVVLGYAHPDDELHSVLWELGVALAYDKKIYLVGEKEKFGKYFGVAGVKRFNSLETALADISRLVDYEKK